ncbi:MAG: hypothetical protein WCK29_02510 [archaeon]
MINPEKTAHHYINKYVNFKSNLAAGVGLVIGGTLAALVTDSILVSDPNMSNYIRLFGDSVAFTGYGALTHMLTKDHFSEKFKSQERINLFLDEVSNPRNV